MITRQIVFVMLLLGSTLSGAQADIWTPTGGPADTRVASVIVAPNGNLFAGTIGSGVFRSTDNGSSWAAVNNGLTETDIRTLTAGSGERIYAGTASGLVFYSDDLGDVWNLTNPTGIQQIYSVGFTPAGKIFASGNGGICRSTDTGSNWDLLDIGMPQIMAWFATLIIDETTLLAGSMGMGAIKSTNAGTTWTQIFPGPPDNTIYSFLRTPGDEIFAATAMGMYKSVDAGVNWTSLQNPENSDITSFVITSAGDYVAVTGAGVFASPNEGAVWHEANSGLEDLPVTGLAVSGETVFAGTDGGGVYVSQMVTSVEPTGVSPSAFLLEQNYPNPFNPSTDIRFEISDYGLVTLRVYDMLGQEVATLVNQSLEAGSYSLAWSAENVPSGVYLYRLESGNHTETRKMVLMK